MLFSSCNTAQKWCFLLRISSVYVTKSAVGTLCQLTGYILRTNFPGFQKCPYNVFLRTLLMYLPDTYINDKLLDFALFVLAQSIRSWARVTKFVNLKRQTFFFLYFVLEVETTKSENYYFHACINLSLALYWS